MRDSLRKWPHKRVWQVNERSPADGSRRVTYWLDHREVPVKLLRQLVDEGRLEQDAVGNYQLTRRGTL